MAKVLFTSNINRVTEKIPRRSENLGLVITTLIPRTTLWKMTFRSSLKRKYEV